MTVGNAIGIGRWLYGRMLLLLLLLLLEYGIVTQTFALGLLTIFTNRMLLVALNVLR